ncbi:hypothetical protein ACFPA8_16070 [Streptomyces ovatisporus]|uniref:Polymorphic outer membrane protein n=1 Tax=Streptomyces ovatisporus TaxID=1128682 RepID=A0ABV9A9R4_9ACTN
MRCNDITAPKNAITQANTGGGRITLASHCTYTLTAPDNADDGLPEITGNVTISGRDTTIRRAPDATQDFRVFHVVTGGKLTLNSLRVSGGSLAGNGGGIANENGRLNLNRTTIRGNHADMGGGLFNTGGKLNLEHSTIERNTTDAWGAGIYNVSGGTLAMKGGSLLRNRAGNNGGGLENIAARRVSELRVGQGEHRTPGRRHPPDPERDPAPQVECGSANAAQRRQGAGPTRWSRSSVPRPRSTRRRPRVFRGNRGPTAGQREAEKLCARDAITLGATR